ncbi:MAG TPA: bifunctional DNA-formamidopyrimidine glycosylase/DNA-(apurinic or apyrimidinic site) lyase [Anaerolineales bacterium]
MPELPEVETIARRLRPDLVGATIARAELLWARTLAVPSPRAFKNMIAGRQIESVGRRAKFLILGLPGYSLLVHLRMSGDIFLRPQGAPPAPHDRMRLSLVTPDGSPAQLVFNDARKFGRVWFTDRPESVLGALGPEPFSDEFTPAWLYDALRSRRRQLKPLLLDQTFLAGLGNIYTDEALHRARLHPLRLSDSLSRRKAGTLWLAVRAVLDEGIRRNGASFDWVYRGGEFQNDFRVYGRAGEPCPVCGATIKRLVIGQRGTHICPRCQRME